LGYVPDRQCFLELSAPYSFVFTAAQTGVYLFNIVGYFGQTFVSTTGSGLVIGVGNSGGPGLVHMTSGDTLSVSVTATSLGPYISQFWN